MRMKIACKADVSYSFPGGEIEQVSEQAGERRSMPVVRKKTGRSGEGMSKKREGWEEEESFARLTPSPCSLFLALSRSFVPFACFLETPATQGRMKTANFIKALND